MDGQKLHGLQYLWLPLDGTGLPLEWASYCRERRKKKNKPHIVMEWIDLMVLLIAHETHPVCVPLMPFVRCLVFKGGRMSVKWPDWIRSALRSLINTFSSAAAAAAAVDRGENKDLKNMHFGTFFFIFLFIFFGLCWFKSKSQPDTVKKKKRGQALLLPLIFTSNT